jgi:hypothetical protein
MSKRPNHLAIGSSPDPLFRITICKQTHKENYHGQRSTTKKQGSKKTKKETAACRLNCPSLGVIARPATVAH